MQVRAFTILHWFTSTSMQLQKGNTGVGLQPMRVRTSTLTTLFCYKTFPQTIHEIRKRPVVGAHVTTSEAVSRFFFDIFLFAASAWLISPTHLRQVDG